MIRSLIVAVPVAAAALFFAAPAAADDGSDDGSGDGSGDPGFSLPHVGFYGFDPSVTLCWGLATPIPELGIGGCTPDVLP